MKQRLVQNNAAVLPSSLSLRSIPQIESGRCVVYTESTPLSALERSQSLSAAAPIYVDRLFCCATGNPGYYIQKRINTIPEAYHVSVVVCKSKPTGKRAKYIGHPSQDWQNEHASEYALCQ